MSRNTKKATGLTLVLVALTVFLVALSVPSGIAQAPDDAIVVLLDSAGGTTNPVPGNYSYANGTSFVLTAVPDAGFEFKYWIVSGEYTPGHTTGIPNYIIDPDTGEVIGSFPRALPTTSIDALVLTANPLNITCGFGYTFTYQAVFAPIIAPGQTTPPPQTLPPTSTTATVIILPAVGGTTSPAAGTYTHENGTSFTLSATPRSGFTFHYWIVTGSYTPGHQAQPDYIPGVTEQIPSVPPNIYLPTQDSVVFSTNPVTITCGYGYTYEYQAVFDPVNATVPVIPTSTPLATPAVTATPTASPAATSTPTETTGGIDITVIAAIVVIVIIIIIAVVVVAMRRKK